MGLGGAEVDKEESIPGREELREMRFSSAEEVLERVQSFVLNRGDFRVQGGGFVCAW